MAAPQMVQCFGKKRNATAVAQCKAGKGLIRVNGRPLQLVEPAILRTKVYEPLLVVGLDKFAQLDIRVRVSGGGHTSQIYAVRQAISKALIAYNQKYNSQIHDESERTKQQGITNHLSLHRFVDEHTKNTLKTALTGFDRTLLVADNRRCEPKKFGGPGARARFQKSYR